MGSLRLLMRAHWDHEPTRHGALTPSITSGQAPSPSPACAAEAALARCSPQPAVCCAAPLGRARTAPAPRTDDPNSALRTPHFALDTVAPLGRARTAPAPRTDERNSSFRTPHPVLALLLGFQIGAAASAAPVWETGPGFRSAPLTVPRVGQAGFTQLPASQTAIHFTNHLSNAAVAENQIRLIGSGVALGDVDGDQLCDIYFCRLEGPNALYRNLGNWKFEEITARAGVGCPDQFSTGCTLADVDGDGDLDLLVTGLGTGTRLFLNDGQGRFAEATNAGLTRRFGSTSLALADVDGDGDLDLYVANYRTTTIRSTGMKVLNVNGRQVIRPEDRDQYEFTAEGLLLEHGEADALYLNDGQGRFASVPWTGGSFLNEHGQPLASGPRDWGLSVQFRDMNGDRRPDLYVCNDFHSPDRVWWNESRPGQVRFRAAPALALRHTSTFSMGVDFADINRDGLDDFIVLDMLSRDHPRRLRQRSMMGQATATNGRLEDRPQIDRNTLFLNRGDGTYAEIAELAGVPASEWSWGVVFLDVDLDGYEDLLITTGHGFDTQDADTETRLAARGPGADQGAEAVGARVLEFPRLNVANVAFRNRGNLTFEECAGRWGFAQAGVSHGLALADLDQDGDLDVAVNNLNAAAGIFRNEAAQPRTLVRLNGRPPNTRGIGARIRFLGGPVAQSQELLAGGRYLSSDEAARVFATGRTEGGLSIEVTWRDGGRSLVKGAQPNRLYEIDEAMRAAPAAAPAMPAADPSPFFREITALTHRHHDEVFDDFARQPLLPRRLSQLGPGISWIDLDGDGREELLIGSGRGGGLGIWKNGGDGGFDAMRVGGALARASDDLTTVLGWSTGAGTVALWVGQASYETSGTNLPSALGFEVQAGRMRAAGVLPGLGASAGPMALGDVDGDGDLDLFVGGRAVGGRYPEAATSRLFRNEGGTFVPGQEWPSLGMVSGATFSDLTGDGFPELLLATEWGPLILLRNVRGQLENWSVPVRFPEASMQAISALEQLTGWWNGVATGDFDSDGRLDIVASNWGQNTPYESRLKEGWRLYYGDLGGRGTVEILEAFHDEKYGRVVPWRDLDTVAESMPWVRERAPSNVVFSELSVQQLLGERFQQAREVRVRWLASTVFLNRGDRFEVRPLPVQAQLAPALGVCVGDYDGDGREDLFLSQNFFAVNRQDARQDSGRGLWLRGDGRGEFAAVAGERSGVRTYGDQRGAALADYDGDGRIDLAVGQNGGETKLFHNEQGQPGLRVRLRGSAGNYSGIGAVLQWAPGPGAAREVRAGSGYWSQDSPVLVLARPASAARLQVRWAGGKETVSTVPDGAREVAVDATGAVEEVRQ